MFLSQVGQDEQDQGKTSGGGDRQGNRHAAHMGQGPAMGGILTYFVHPDCRQLDQASSGQNRGKEEEGGGDEAAVSGNQGHQLAHGQHEKQEDGHDRNIVGGSACPGHEKFAYARHEKDLKAGSQSQGQEGGQIVPTETTRQGAEPPLGAGIGQHETGDQGEDR